MIALFRLLIITPLFIIVCLLGCAISLVRPFHRNNTFVVAKLLTTIAPFCGIKLLTRIDKDLAYTPKVFIANHQNNYDLFTITSAVSEGTVSIGKKSLRWVPFFGQLYWLSGNILIDRKNKRNARATIQQVVERIHTDQLSVWLFPEGTRNRGRGLLPFKMGAFHTAIDAKVPIVLIVQSTTSGFKLNRWNNGYAITEVLEPIPTDQYTKNDVKDLAERCRTLMIEKIIELDREVSELNKS